MSRALTRRELLQLGGTAAAGAIFGVGRCACAAPHAVVGDISVISKDLNLYHGWPTVGRRRNGELLLVHSGGREEHCCPFGRLELMRSGDNGQTWSDPVVLCDTDWDERDAGVMETSKGTILVVWFDSLTGLNYVLAKAEKIPTDKPGAWPPEKLKRWQQFRDRLSPEQLCSKEARRWIIRSNDDGKTWSEPQHTQLGGTVHGPFELSDSRLMCMGGRRFEGRIQYGAQQSCDDGRTWQWLGEIPPRAGDKHCYHELHGVEAADGRIIGQIREECTKKYIDRQTLQVESSDGGKTWSVPHSIGVVGGFPSHLLRLKDNRLLMTCGYRRKPYGNRAWLSEDNGRTWLGPLVISDDGMQSDFPNRPRHTRGAVSDLGYASTVQLDDGSLLTVWYEVTKASMRAVLRQARWTIES